MSTPTPPGHPSLIHDPHLRRLLYLICYMVLGAGLIYALSLLWPFLSGILRILSPFIAALVVAYLFNPVVNFVQKRLKLTRIGGVIAVVLFLFFITAVFIGILVPILAVQVRSAYQGIESTAKQRVIPFVYEALGFDPEPGAASVESLSARVEEWVAYQNPTAQTEDLRRRHSTLRREVAEWVDSVTVPRENGEVDATKTVTSEEDLVRLDGIIAAWRASVRDVAPAEASLARTEDLERSVDQWIDHRRDYMAGNIQTPAWDDFRLRAFSWMRERGIQPEETMRTVAASDQFRFVATEGVGVLGTLFVLFLAAVMSLIGSAMFLFFAALVSFYLLIDFDEIHKLLKTVVPPQHDKRFFEVLANVDKAVGGFIRGQIFVAFIVGTLTTFGLMLFGLKQYALLIGIAAGAANLVPYLGPIVGATPAVLWVLLTDSYDTTQERLFYLVIMIGMFAMIQSFESFVLQPKVVGKSASLHPVVVMAALVLGARFGILGMIIAIPVVCIVRVLLKEFFWDKRAAALEEREREQKERDNPPPPQQAKANSA